MAAIQNINTFFRRAMEQLPWDGPRFASLFGWVTGLAPDSLAEGHRTVARMLLPLPESPVDILPYLARAMGVPLYPVHDTSSPTGYAATLARLQATLATHAVAGSSAGLVVELIAAGLLGDDYDVAVVPDADQTLQAFDVVADSDPPETYGGGATYGDGTIYGRQLTADQARGLLAVMAYFRAAGARFREVVIP